LNEDRQLESRASISFDFINEDIRFTHKKRRMGNLKSKAEGKGDLTFSSPREVEEAPYQKITPRDVLLSPQWSDAYRSVCL